MPTDFKYVPVSGPLAGHSFEEQTERAFNELGANIDIIQNAADSAISIAENAQTASGEALNTANSAITAAQHAESSAESAHADAAQALVIAQETESAVTEAVDVALAAQAAAADAHDTANHAQETADTAIEKANHADSVAISAEILANAAYNSQSGGFVVANEPVDANSTVTAQRIYAVTEIIGTPVEAPAYFVSMPTSDQAAITQETWAEDAPTAFLRTGSISWNATPGSDTQQFTATPVEGTDIIGTLGVTHTGAALSATFNPGVFNGAQTSLFELGGEVSFTLGEGFAGSIYSTNSGVELVRIENGTAVLMSSEVRTSKFRTFLVSAAYAVDTLVLATQITWRDKDYTVDWGSWYAGGGGGASIPQGLICMWSGSVPAIPHDWALCDGTNGTPDLRDRFIVGAGGAYAPGSTGGNDAHTHTATAANTTAATTISSTTAATTIGATTLALSQIPSHRHTSTYDFLKGVGGTVAPPTTGGARSYATVVTDYVGGGESHTHTAAGTAHTHTATGTAHTHTLTVASGEHTPPYYALAYIMKL